MPSAGLAMVTVCALLATFLPNTPKRLAVPAKLVALHSQLPVAANIHTRPEGATNGTASLPRLLPAMAVLNRVSSKLSTA